MAVENEKRVGVNSGGMDQAASILSLPYHPLYISFYPKLALTQIPLISTNPATCFVIANSMKVSDKLVNAKAQYNLRVVETLAGARVLARGLGVEIGLKEKITFREVLSRWSRETQGSDMEDVKALEIALEQIIPEVERVLGIANGKDGLTLDEMIEATGLSNSNFNDIYFSWVEGRLHCEANRGPC
jgi:galactokinase